jgi:preprotein translocase subunit SecA
MEALYGGDITVEELKEEVEMTAEALTEEFAEDAWDTYQEREQRFGTDETGQPIMRDLERYILLSVVDVRWREHLESMDYLREGVHLRAMAQKDPLVEYTAEGHQMFEELSAAIREEVVLHLFHAEIEPADAAELQAAQEAQALDGGGLAYEHQSLAGADAIAAAGGGNGAAAMTGIGTAAAGGAFAGATSAGGGTAVTTRQRVVSEQEKIGRNDPCWCGSGKKFKKCHGA